MTMVKTTKMNFLKAIGKSFRAIFRFILIVFAKVLADSAKEKEYEPTTQELMYGKRIMGSDKYIIPNQKIRK